MKQFVHSKLFSLFAESVRESVPATQWEQSYEAFAVAVFAASVKSNNCKDFHKSLCYTSVELASLTGVSEKKCPNLSQQSPTTY
jgi:hypothetical protein